MLPAEAQLVVIGEALDELITIARRHESLLERIVLLLGEQSRRAGGRAARPAGTLGDLAREMAEVNRQMRINRYYVPIMRWLKNHGGRATRTEWRARFRGNIVAEALTGLERDGLIRTERHGRFQILVMTDIAAKFLEEND